jgi:hypothetical protein
VQLIALADYWMGRDRSHAAELSQTIRRNAGVTVERINALLALAAADGIAPGVDQVTGTHVASGWRPRGINAGTANAAAKSTHLTAEACDLQDHPDRQLARWCIRNLHQLEAIGLWAEDPRWTGGTNNRDPWLHLQTRAPGSGRRVYAPSTAPAGDPAFYQRFQLVQP